MAEVRFEHIAKRYGDHPPVITDLTLMVRDAEFLVLVGPSGCGKSTILRMVAGLEAITAGDLYIGSRRVNEVEAKDRDVAMVFQSYALYPHKTVYDNLAFPLRRRGMASAEIDERVRKTASMLGIEPYLRRKPNALSGGQRQRVALGRALVREPRVFLMDEPLSNLDTQLRVQTRAEIARLHQRVPVTTIYVTHDQAEAMTMGDRIAVLNAGAIQQLGTPQEVYDTPANVFVAGFIGSPAMNIFDGRLIAPEGSVAVIEIAGRRFTPPPGRTAQLAALATACAEGRPVLVGIRPEDLALAAAGTENALAGTVDLVEHLGAEQLVYVTIPGRRAPDSASLPGATAAWSATARLPARAHVAPGEQITLAIAENHLHLFDAATGQRFA